MHFLNILFLLTLLHSATIIIASIDYDKVDQPDLAKHDSSVLDLVFAIDATGSMGAYIRSATEHIRSIVEEIVTSEKSDVRLALVEYRDHPPQDTTFVTRVHDFTRDVMKMKEWLEQCQAAGGGDGPEAVADALYEVLKLSWRPEATKIVILISDAPPHGLDPQGDHFPNGCPNGHDPMKIVREMTQRYITLYTVGVEPPIVPYRDFFKTLAYITGGQYVPMKNAQLLARVIIGSVREELSLDRLMKDAEEDIVRKMRHAMSEGLSDDEMSRQVGILLGSKDARAHRMENKAGEVLETVSNVYSACEDMNEMKEKYKKTETGSEQSVADEVLDDESATAAYELATDKEVSVEQAKRIVQKMKLHL